VTRVEVLNRAGQIRGFFFTPLSVADCEARLGPARDPRGMAGVPGRWVPAGGVGTGRWYEAPGVGEVVQVDDDLLTS
jgi:hypothetical protein